MAMRMREAVLSAVVVANATAAAAAAPERTPRQVEIDQRITAEVTAASPEAGELFERGNVAREEGNFEVAAGLYQQAEELVPELDHPHRRACTALAQAGLVDEGLEECEAALRLNPGSAYNQSALAMTLSQRGRPADIDRALALAREAVDQQPDDPDALSVLCMVTASAGRYGPLRRCVEDLLAVDPDSLAGNYLGALVAGRDGALDTARARLERARAAGLDDATYQGISSELEGAAGGAADPRGDAESALGGQFWSVALWLVMVWLGLMVLLLLAGWVLSRLTLRAVERVATRDPSADGTPGERRLRQLYKVVVFLCGVYFYFSVPILLVSIAVLGGGLIYFFFAVGTIPIKLVLLIGLIVLLTLGAILRGLFVRAGRAELGFKIDLDRSPRLRALLHDVAGKIETRPVDSVYLTSSTDMAVTERAGLWRSVRGASSERCLIMGIGLFDGMSQGELRSVLAHEHGHFRNQDTAGGGFALAVRRSLLTMIVRLAESGAATAYNPVWWFLRGYHRVYLVVSQGASRLQEVLADRWAIRAYGSEPFIGGYTHVVTRSVEFDHHVQATLEEVIEEERSLPNLYRYEPARAESADDFLAEAIEAAMNQEPSAYDSHPAPGQRIAWARAMAMPHEPGEEDDRPVWALFEDREALEHRLTSEVREAVAVNHGVAIAGTAAPLEQDEVGGPR